MQLPVPLPFSSPTEFLSPASSGELCVQHTAQLPTVPETLPSAHSKYGAVFIRIGDDLSLNFECSHYQRAPKEILLAGSVALAEVREPDDSIISPKLQPVSPQACLSWHEMAQ